MTAKNLIDRILANQYLKRFISKASAGQLFRYLITGFSSAAIELAILYVLKDIVMLKVVVANSIALTLVFWFNFLMNRFWSFKSKTDIRKQLVMYFILFAFNLAASDAIMYVLATLLHVQYLLAKIFAIGAVVTWNFILYKKVIYK